MTRIDLTGRTVFEWTVVAYSHSEGRHCMWRLRCSCGVERMFQSRQVLTGRIRKSCGHNPMPNRDPSGRYAVGGVGGPGRRPLPRDVARVRPVSVHVSASELVRIQSSAKAANTTVSDYIRSRIL